MASTGRMEDARQAGYRPPKKPSTMRHDHRVADQARGDADDGARHAEIDQSTNRRLDQAGADDGDDAAEHAAGDAHGERFQPDELEDVAAIRAERLHDADLAGALVDAHEDGVDDADHRDDDGDDGHGGDHRLRRADQADERVLHLLQADDLHLRQLQPAAFELAQLERAELLQLDAEDGQLAWAG